METVVSKEATNQAELRIMYRKLLHELQERQEELGNIENYQLVGFMHDSQELFDKVTGPQEAVIDAKVMKLLAKFVRMQAEQMSSNITQFTYQEYAGKLLASMQVDRSQQVTSMTSMKMIRLGHQLKTRFRRSPPLTFLYGAVDFTQPPVKEKVIRTRQACRVEDLVETVSNTVTVVERTENQTEQLVTQVFRSLVIKYKETGRMPLDYFRFVMDPDSFGTSIENIFHVSFLVKEGKVAIFVSKETGLPMIMPVRSNYMQGQEENKDQLVMNICMEDWVRIVDRLGIEESVIKKMGK
eukprot:GFUD01035388.1.p1 GENE.GFUD01035388.1~~GFUD01035388.1.p1  ORF type:complete len:297 (+),score=109.68 GFUD01035388.1:120-1010(+)